MDCCMCCRRRRCRYDYPCSGQSIGHGTAQTTIATCRCNVSKPLCSDCRGRVHCNLFCLSLSLSWIDAATVVCTVLLLDASTNLSPHIHSITNTYAHVCKNQKKDTTLRMCGCQSYCRIALTQADWTRFVVFCTHSLTEFHSLKQSIGLSLDISVCVCV